MKGFTEKLIELTSGCVIVDINLVGESGIDKWIT
jgi:FixJ family two-component response regulator